MTKKMSRTQKREYTRKLEEDFLIVFPKYHSYDEMGADYHVSPSHIRRVIMPKAIAGTGKSRRDFLFVPGRGNFSGNGGHLTPFNTTVAWKEFESRLAEVDEIARRLKEEEYE